MAMDCYVLEKDSPDCGLASFLAMISHDDRGSFYHIMRRDPRLPDQSPLKWAGFSRGAKHLAQFEFEEGYDWFITRNGFSSRLSRKAEMCRQLNSFLFDIDVHDPSADAEFAVNLVLSTLESAWNSGAIPVPTMVLTTGRGVHAYYALGRSTAVKKSDGSDNEKGVKFFRDIEARLCLAVEEALSPLEEAKVDRSVFDSSRVARVPGTVNSKTGSKCRVVYDSGVYHSLEQLSRVLPNLLRPERRRPGGGAFKKRDRFGQLATCRMRGIEKLQEARGFVNTGNRELMCFCYYNSAVQKYESRDDAFDVLVAFNRRFTDPLPQSELDNIRSSVDKVGFYQMGASKISAFLNLTEEEAIETGFFMTKRDIEREASKARTAEKKRRRNARILFLSNIPNVTKDQIAEETGCSTRTVYTVISKPDVPRAIPLGDATRLTLDFNERKERITANKTEARILQTGDGQAPLDGAVRPQKAVPTWPGERAGP